MPLYHLQCRMFVPRSITEVFEVFENPHNLARITPSWLRFRVTTSGQVTMAEGARIEYTIRWLVLPMKWRTIITRYVPPREFIDEQERGPYVLWRHTHTFTEVEGGVLVEDSVEYQLPFGPLGVLAHATLVSFQLLGIFRYRQRAITGIFGVPLDQRQEPNIEVLEPENGRTIRRAT